MTGAKKFAPAAADGTKPYVVTVWQFGRESEEIIYAAKSSDAVYARKGRMRYTTARARRATVEDLERLAASTTGGSAAAENVSVPACESGTGTETHA